MFISGILAFVGGVSGVLFSGIVISKFNLGTKKMLTITYLCPLVCAFLSGLFFLSCENKGIKFIHISNAPNFMV